VAAGTSFARGRGIAARPGRVEYWLARQATVRDYRRGRLSRREVCDAQGELLRVAQSLGAPTGTDCPICEEAKVVHVSFAFGPRLPAGGRALRSGAELDVVARRSGEVVCYVVEVCLRCSWNHLLRSFGVALSEVDGADGRKR
jgi:hypothetical protein